MTDEHVLFTRMLLIDGIVGVGFPHEQVGIDAERGGLARHYTTHGEPPTYLWNRRILETLSTDTLQDLYTGLKLHEVTHAD